MLRIYPFCLLVVHECDQVRVNFREKCEGEGKWNCINSKLQKFVSSKLDTFSVDLSVHSAAQTFVWLISFILSENRSWFLLSTLCSVSEVGIEPNHIHLPKPPSVLESLKKIKSKVILGLNFMKIFWPNHVFMKIKKSLRHSRTEVLCLYITWVRYSKTDKHLLPLIWSEGSWFWTWDVWILQIS